MAHPPGYQRPPKPCPGLPGAGGCPHGALTSPSSGYCAECNKAYTRHRIRLNKADFDKLKEAVKLLAEVIAAIEQRDPAAAP